METFKLKLIQQQQHSHIMDDHRYLCYV